jgi:hypothetical protein
MVIYVKDVDALAKRAVAQNPDHSSYSRRRLRRSRTLSQAVETGKQALALMANEPNVPDQCDTERNQSLSGPHSIP